MRSLLLFSGLGCSLWCGLSVLLQHHHWNLPWLRALVVPGPAAPCAFCRGPDGMVEHHLPRGMRHVLQGAIGLNWIWKGTTNLKGRLEWCFFLVVLPQISDKIRYKWKGNTTYFWDHHITIAQDETTWSWPTFMGRLSLSNITGLDVASKHTR